MYYSPATLNALKRSAAGNMWGRQAYKKADGTIVHDSPLDTPEGEAMLGGQFDQEFIETQGDPNRFINYKPTVEPVRGYIDSSYSNATSGFSREPAHAPPSYRLSPRLTSLSGIGTATLSAQRQQNKAPPSPFSLPTQRARSSKNRAFGSMGGFGGFR